MRRAAKPLILSLFATGLLVAAFALPAGRAQAAKPKPPNILFIIMDDVGIDQFQKTFGFGAENAAPTPVMDTLASSGLRFRNVWAMAECSPSRALMLTGRYPLRTHVYAPLQPADLANSQVSPYETAVPKVLKHAGYASALFGKHHVGGAENYPNGDQSPALFGFDYFHGPMGGKTAGAKPDPIDTTAGGVGAEGIYPCGYVPNRDADGVNGADSGACYFADGRSCTVITKSDADPHPGRACLQQGGILVPEVSCDTNPPHELDFGETNAYYVWSFGETDPEDDVIKQRPLTDPRSRTYWPTEITTAAIGWIKAQSGPWMATVSYPSIHDPYQQPPRSLTPDRTDIGGECAREDIVPEMTSQILQAMDTEIGRLLVETGLASRTSDGQLRYTPAASNTMIAVVGDNGSFGRAVRAPFDASRAKGTVFQTGVWVPLIVAGPLVQSPDRDVEAMVNVADLFELWGEVAGLDVHKIVPRSRVLDSQSMLPYLTQPSRPGVRRYNFAQTGINFTANGARPGPCVLPMALLPPATQTCTQLMADRQSCMDEGGIWYGEGGEGKRAYTSCCDLLLEEPNPQLQERWLSQEAVRNDGFKLVRTTYENCKALADPTEPPTLTLHTLHKVDQETPTLDGLNSNLINSQLSPLEGLEPEEAKNYGLLKHELERVLASEVECPGDGNKDGVVDETDIANWAAFAAGEEPSSWYDFPRPNEEGVFVYDGVTDERDLQVILENLGRCPRK